MTNDTFDLNRFVTAQAPIFDRVLAELQAAAKRTHWMWFVFPQLRGLGHSYRAEHYGLRSLDEARAYLAHDLLGSRLRLCTQTVLNSDAPSLHAIFGSPDDLKFQSCMTVFEALGNSGDTLFGSALDRWCGGKRDERTLRLLNPTAGR